MNTSQKKLFRSFIISTCAIVAVCTGILAYGVYLWLLSATGDIFDKLHFEKHLTWIVPTLVALGGLFLVGVVAVLGFWRIIGDKETQDRKQI